MDEFKPLATAAAIAIVLVLIASHTSHAAAQERPAPAVELAAGALLFADDGIVTEGFAGGAVRFYVLPRVGIGPEIAYVAGENHSHWMVTANLTFDLVGPERGEPAPVTPFIVVGGGLFRTRQPLPNNQTFTSTEGAFTAGGGLRARVGRRLFVGAEARVGWELHIRVNGLVGVQLGG